MIAAKRRVSDIIAEIYDIGCEGGAGKPDSSHNKIRSYTKPGHSQAKCSVLGVASPSLFPHGHTLHRRFLMFCFLNKVTAEAICNVPKPDSEYGGPLMICMP
jgi:hypothetical protein